MPQWSRDPAALRARHPDERSASRCPREAAPLLAVTSVDGDEVLVPFAKAFLVAVDVDGKRIDMRLTEGLVEVNRQPDARHDQKR